MAEACMWGASLGDQQTKKVAGGRVVWRKCWTACEDGQTMCPRHLAMTQALEEAKTEKERRKRVEAAKANEQKRARVS